jgi:hypothetical protein
MREFRESNGRPLAGEALRPPKSEGFQPLGAGVMAS